jgi:hypothetical protein
VDTGGFVYQKITTVRDGKYQFTNVPRGVFMLYSTHMNNWRLVSVKDGAGSVECDMGRLHNPEGWQSDGYQVDIIGDAVPGASLRAADNLPRAFWTVARDYYWVVDGKLSGRNEAFAVTGDMVGKSVRCYVGYGGVGGAAEYPELYWSAVTVEADSAAVPDKERGSITLRESTTAGGVLITPTTSGRASQNVTGIVTVQTVSMRGQMVLYEGSDAVGRWTMNNAVWQQSWSDEKMGGARSFRLKASDSAHQFHATAEVCQAGYQCYTITSPTITAKAQG